MSNLGNTTGRHTPTNPTQSSMSVSTNGGSVAQTSLHQQGGGEAEGGGDNEQKTATGETSNSMQQMMVTMQQQMQATMQQQMQLFREEQQKTLQQMFTMHQQQQAASTERLQRTTDTTAHRQSFPQHSLMSPAVVEYSAGASLPLPPRVPSQPRSSFGIPSTPAAFVPFTPVAQRAAAASVVEEHDESEKDDEHHDDAVDVAAAVEGMPARDKRMEHVRKTMLTSVKPFHGQTAKDTYTVIDWVEKVDTEFSIHMGDRQAGRLDVVRSLLAGSALKWMNRKLQEMNMRNEAVEWQVVRREFIDVHLGASTIETFKAQLRSLRLGSEGCKNPSELNTQFDHLAELAFPQVMADRRTDSAMASVLGEEYRRIVANSDQLLWRNIERNAAPTTLDEWKLALGRHWSAEETIKNLNKQLRPREQLQSYRGRGGAPMRGGYGRGGGYSSGAPISVNTISESGASMEGEEHTVEGEPEPQLSAVASSSRGGRGGGRGGDRRGRGGVWTSERLKLYEEQKCFNCKKPGHVRAACPSPPTPKPQQSNEKADQ
jgi:Zinc knuckle